MIKFIPNVKQAWRMFSVQAMTLATAIQGAWLGAPEDLKASVPQAWVTYLTIALLACGVVGRLVHQPKVEGGAQ